MFRCAVLAIVLPALCLAQDAASAAPPTRAGNQVPPPVMQATIQTEDGSSFADSPQVIKRTDCEIRTVFGDGRILFRYLSNQNALSIPNGTSPGLPPCEVTIVVPGYRAANVMLSNGRKIVLKPLGLTEGSTVSIVALRAPAPARKEYDRGQQALVHKKWAEAAEHFTRAKELYPEYASAWSGLGASLEQQGKGAEAEQAFRQAISVEPKYLKPYAQLAALLNGQRRFADNVPVIEAAFALNPIEFPEIYGESARANLGLGRLDIAERSARMAIEIDTYHRVPQAEYFLGEVLAAKGNRKDAAEEMKKYLADDKHGAYASEARRNLAEWR